MLSKVCCSCYRAELVSIVEQTTDGSGLGGLRCRGAGSRKIGRAGQRSSRRGSTYLGVVVGHFEGCVGEMWVDGVVWIEMAR